MARTREQALFGAAVLKLSFLMKKMHHQPGFRVVYFGTLAEFNLTDAEVNAFIQSHRLELEAHLGKRLDSTEESLP
jgi:hypothetical protein